MIRREDRLAVGSMGFKAPPDTTGTVEIGYAVNRSQRGRGYATEMAGALVAWALRPAGGAAGDRGVPGPQRRFRPGAGEAPLRPGREAGQPGG